MGAAGQLVVFAYTGLIGTSVVLIGSGIAGEESRLKALLVMAVTAATVGLLLLGLSGKLGWEVVPRS